MPSPHFSARNIINQAQTLALVIFLLSIPFTCLAQRKVIEVDSISGQASQSFPFDEAFYLKIPIKTQQVSEVYCIPHKKGETFAQAFPQTSRHITYPKNKFGVKTGKINYLVIQVDENRKLDPGQAYTFFWSGDVSDEELDVFDSYDDSIRTSTAGATVAPGYRKLVKEHSERFGLEMAFNTRDIHIGYPNSLAQWYTLVPPSSNPTQTIRQGYIDLDAAQSTYLANLPALPTPAPSVAAVNTAYQTLIRLIIQRREAFDTKWKNAYIQDARKAEFRLLKLQNLTPAVYTNLLQGRENLDCMVCKNTPLRQAATRLATIKATAASLDELYTVAASLSVSEPALNPVVLLLQNYTTSFQRAVSQMAPVVQARKTIQDRIFSLGVSRLSALSGDAFIYSFETRNRASITPDVGIAVPFVGKASPYPFLPYIGFHVNLRPLNRDVPFNTYTHKGLNRFSLMLGWSLVNIDNGPIRTARPEQDSIASFFNGKGTLLVGGGYRLGNAVRITAGGICYFKYHLTDPKVPMVYNDRRFGAWPFVGIAVDLALKDLLNGIADVFPATPRRFVPTPTP